MKPLPLATLCLFSHLAIAGSSGLDRNFGSGGALLVGPTPQSGLGITIKAITPLPDGTFLVGGRSQADPTHPTAELAAVGHLNADGSWDTTFGDHGLFALPYGVTAAPLGGEIHHIVVQGDGSIVAVGGTFKDTEYLGMHTCTLVMQLSASGALQPGFGGTTNGVFCFDFAPDSSGGTVKGHVEDISLAPDGGFIVTTGLTNLPHGAAARFLADGTIDPAFGNDGVIDVPFLSWVLARQADGRTLLVGSPHALFVERIEADGSTDPSYANAGVLSFDMYSDGTFTNPMSGRLDDNERLVIADIDVGTGVYVPYRIGSVNADGQLDTNFNGAHQQPGIPGLPAVQIPGAAFNDGIVDAFPLPDGRVFGLGYGSGTTNSADPDYIVTMRLNADASFDAAFGDPAHPGWAKIAIGSAANGNSVTASALDAHGRVLAATRVTDDNADNCPALIRLTVDDLFADGFEAAASLVCPD